VTALLERERIRTTDAKAKEVRRLTERMITLGKDGSLAARRRALAFIQRRVVVKRLFDDIAPRFKDRPGGYTRTIKLGIRHGDAAPPQPVSHFGRCGGARVFFFFPIHVFSLTRLRRLARSFGGRRHPPLGQLEPCPGESNDQGEKTPARSGIANAE